MPVWVKPEELWWRLAAVLTCKSIVKYGHGGERLIEPSSSWFPPSSLRDSKLAMRDEPNARLRCQSRRSSDTTKGRWPWKSESAKDCVTTHLPNVLALKMDGAQASHPYLALRILVVVANTSMRLEGPKWGRFHVTAVGHGLVDPKP
ncbi:hypothetical protein Lal_00008635 [Lupinus albus]|nr:hypothetical protein Lal_00008635 [Lupinus albus]